MSDTARRFGWIGPDGSLDIENVREWEEQLLRRREELKDRIEVLAENVVSCRVCALWHLAANEVQALTNEINPAGTTRGWQIMENVLPVRCSDNPDRLHWLLVC